MDVKRRFEPIQESCRARRRKVASIVAEALALVEELVQQVGGSSIQVEDNATLGTVPVIDTDVLPLTAKSK